MSSNKFVTIATNGIQSLVEAIAASAGVADANKVVRTGSDGRLASSLMPSGIGAQTISITATEALAAGSFVNITASGVRLADNSNSRPAQGFVLAAVANAGTATVHLSGLNTALSGLVAGTPMFLGTGGAATATAPTASGTVLQRLGDAVSTSILSFESDGYTLIA